MKRHYAAQRWICAWACVGMIAPFSAIQGQQPGPQPDRPVAPAVDRVTDPAPAILDVELAPGGVLSGQVVDAGGTPLAQVPVSVWRDTTELGRTVSDKEGRFAISGLNGGLHRVVAADGKLGMQLCRAGRRTRLRRSHSAACWSWPRARSPERTAPRPCCRLRRCFG